LPSIPEDVPVSGKSSVADSSRPLRQHHNAMADAYACAHIALTMMREKEVDTLEALMASCYSR